MKELEELRRWLHGEILKIQSANRDAASKVWGNYLTGQEDAYNRAIKKIDAMLAEAQK